GGVPGAEERDEPEQREEQGGDAGAEESSGSQAPRAGRSGSTNAARAAADASGSAEWCAPSSPRSSTRGFRARNSSALADGADRIGKWWIGSIQPRVRVAWYFSAAIPCRARNARSADAMRAVASSTSPSTR